MPEQMNLLSPLEAREQKQAALDQVEENNDEWMDRALTQLRRGLPNFPNEFLAETIREKLLPAVGMPISHHAWGALTSRAIKLGMIVPTGDFRATRSARTHGHRTAVYRTAYGGGLD